MADDVQAEQDRQARRQTIRQRVAAATIVEDRIRLLTADVERIDSDVDTATDAHSAACGPLQDELSRLETQAIARISQRQQPDESEDARRVEIISEISDANSGLEVAIERAKQMRKPILREIAKAKDQHMSPKVLALELAKDHTADPQLLVQRFVNSRTGTYATARRNAAVKALPICEYNVKEIAAGRMTGSLQSQRRKVAWWEAEILEAERIAAESNREGERIHSEMLAE